MTEQVENKINKDVAIENDILTIIDQIDINKTTASNKCRVTYCNCLQILTHID